MQEILTDVNWIAVVVGAVVAFIVGWLWYSPILFGNKWAAGNGVELGSAQSMPVGAMLMQIISLLLISWFVGVTAVDSKLFTFILAVIGFGLFAVAGGLFRRKSFDVVAIDFGYLIVSAIVMFAAQAIL